MPSTAERTLEFISYTRWAWIRFTSSSVTLTLEVSSMPCLITPVRPSRRHTLHRRATGLGLDKHVLAHGLQARGVDEVGGVDLPHHLGSAIPFELHRHLTILANRHALGVLRDLDLRLQRITVARRDDGPFTVEGELAVAGIGRAAVRQLDLE